MCAFDESRAVNDVNRYQADSINASGVHGIVLDPQFPAYAR
jgi:hypothetical protein